MSEKEKKAIDFLKNDVIYWLDKGKDFVVIDIGYNENLHCILNLIEKQQKEIEELKTITHGYNSYGGNLKNVSKIIICDSRYFLNGTFINKFISKDKIREKMKTLNEVNKNADEIEAVFNIKKLQVLQELLEE